MAFANPVVGGEGGELIRASIKSPNYTPNVDGWSINRDGSAEFNDITIRDGAIVGGDIVIGPAGLPQVVIDSDAFAGFIEFPSNASFESEPARIRVQADPSDPTDDIELRISSAEVTPGEGAFIVFHSESQDLATPQSIEIGLTGAGNIDMTISPSGIAFNGPLVTSDSEVFIDDNSTNGNYPTRVSRGKVATTTNSTTLGVATDTEPTNSSTTGAVLENGIAYRVDVQIQVRQTVGTSAAGTQQYSWKLWDTTVGGTQLGNTVTKWNGSVGNNLDTVNLSFVFQYTGVTGSKTLRLSGADSGGADTLQAQTNSTYYMLVNRIGRPSNIVNL